jgi:hypothetical protein
MELKSMHEGTLDVLEEIKERLEAVETNPPPIPVTPTSQLGLNGLTHLHLRMWYHLI